MNALLCAFFKTRFKKFCAFEHKKERSLIWQRRKTEIVKSIVAQYALMCACHRMYGRIIMQTLLHGPTEAIRVWKSALEKAQLGTELGPGWSGSARCSTPLVNPEA